jgi:UDP-3-O-[3-hydroxymyristoyl] glucosamine N-acyltransferase
MLSDKGFLTIGSCDVHPSARVCIGAVIGKPFRPLLETALEAEAEPKTIIGPNAYVGYYSVIGAGSALDDSVIVDDYCSIESDVRIGARTLVVYRAQICNEACVGSDCVIGGFVAERVVIGDRVRVFGKIIHSHRDPTLGWDAPGALEESAIVEPDAFIGFDALVAGKVVVGSKAYVCAGAIVTRDVPSHYVAYGVNKMVPVDQWKGLLSRSAFFANRRDE